MELVPGNELNEWFATGARKQLSDALINNNKINQYFEKIIQNMRNEAKEIYNQLPQKNYKNMASIGPGNGILECILAQSMNFDTITLIDIEHSEYHRHLYSDSDSAGYANLQATMQFMQDNNILSQFVLCNPTKQALPNQPIDLVISILAMGFHFPMKEYADYIYNNLVSGGVLVFDYRKGVNDTDFQRISPHFTIIESIDSKKSNRLFCMKN